MMSSLGGERIALSQEQLRRWHLLKKLLNGGVCLEGVAAGFGVFPRYSCPSVSRVSRSKKATMKR
jgi:hypothetical protein